MKNEHADNMRLYADDAQETETPWLLWEWKSARRFEDCISSPRWLEDHEYRRIDKFREQKAAFKAGEKIEFRCATSKGKWGRATLPMWCDNHEYRVKPKEDRPVLVYMRAAISHGGNTEEEFDRMVPIELAEQLKGAPLNEPRKPKTVKKWRWVCEHHGDIKIIPGYMTESDAMSLKDCRIRSNWKVIQRIDSTMIEVEA